MAWSQVKADLVHAYRHTVETLANLPSAKRWRARHPKLTSYARRRLSLKDFTGLPLTVVAAALVYTMALFFEIAAEYLEHDPLVAVDIRVANLLYSLRSDGMLRFAYFITISAEAGAVIVLALALTALLWFRRQRIFALSLWLTLITAEGTMFVAKHLFQRARPDALLRAVSEDSFSFPSGHATTAAAFYGFIAYLVIRSGKSWKTRISAVVSAGLIALLVDFSRLYLGVHYLSDVLAGNLVGLAGLLFAIGITEWLIARNFAARPAAFSRVELLVTAAGTLLMVSAISFVIAPLSLERRPSVPPTDIGGRDPLSLFRAGTLPRYTETLIGSRQEPTNIVIIAKEQCLERQMASAGWILADGISLSSTEHIAKAALLNQEYPTAPMTPSFFNAFPNDYGFEKETDRKTIRSRHHARFWKTGYSTDSGILFAGTASLDTGIKWGITHTIAPDIDTERDILVGDLRMAGVIADERQVPFVPPTLGKNFSGEEFFTNGKAAFLTFKACSS